MELASAQRGHDSALDAYQHIAPHYDDFTAHHDYDLWLGNLLQALVPLGLSGRRLLDVACGTGKSFLPMLRRGWTVTASDLSPRMLDRAREKAGPDVCLHVADMRALPVFGAFDLVWCLDDAINYLLSTRALDACLRGLAGNLTSSGLLLFDVNTLLTYRTFFSEAQARELSDRRLVWRGEGNSETEPGSEVVATFEVEDAQGVSSGATHRQRHFRPEEVEEALQGSGLELLALYGHGYDAVLQQPLDEARHTKAVFIARAASG